MQLRPQSEFSTYILIILRLCLGFHTKTVFTLGPKLRPLSTILIHDKCVFKVIQANSLKLPNWLSKVFLSKWPRLNRTLNKANKCFYARRIQKHYQSHITQVFVNMHKYNECYHNILIQLVALHPTRCQFASLEKYTCCFNASYYYSRRYGKQKPAIS